MSFMGALTRHGKPGKTETPYRRRSTALTTAKAAFGLAIVRLLSAAAPLLAVFPPRMIVFAFKRTNISECHEATQELMALTQPPA